MTKLRAAAALAVLGALTLAGCGGGGSQSMGVLPASGNSGSGSNSQTKNGTTMGVLSIQLPNHTGGASAQSTQRAIFSATRKPTYIDTTTQNSALVVAVTPQDPSEAAAYGNLTVCYNLYTAGTLAPQAPPNFTYVAVGNNVSTVTIAIPSPPGTDTFQITQYAGQCGSTPYSLPTPPPTTIGSSNILAQTPAVAAYMAPGATNNINQQIFNCTPQPAPGSPCPLTTANNGTTTLAASVVIANIAFGTFPITSPVREQGAFILAGSKIGVPIPLEALTSSGVVIPGLTTPAVPLGGAGPFPSGVTVTSNDTTTHTALYLVDATNGAIAQAAASNATGLSIHEFNVLSANTTTGLTNNCGASGTASCNDITFGGSTAAAGDPWVIVMTSDGVGPSALASVTVTATATIPPATTPTTITQVITPQAAIYSAGAGGYADAAAPTAPLAMIQPAAAGPVYFTDGNTVKIDGTATVSPATGTTLTGLTYANVAAPLLYAVDNASAGTAGAAPSGLYAFNPLSLAVTPVTTQDGNGNAVQFKAPVASVFAADTSGNSKLFVIDGNGIEIVDINQANQLATNVGPLLCTGTPFAAAPAGVKLFGTAAVGTTSSTFLASDPGNSRIAQVTVSSNYNCTISTYATGAAFTGLAAATGGAYYATSTGGQIYYIPSGTAPITAVSLGFATGTAADGPIGQLASFAPTATPTLTPVNYKLQFATGSFFDSANAYAGTGTAYAALGAPYTILPFGGTKVLAAPVAAGVGLAADTSASATPTTGVIDATGGIIAPISATTAAAATVTPDSLLFVDKAGTGGKIRTIAR